MYFVAVGFNWDWGRDWR